MSAKLNRCDAAECLEYARSRLRYDPATGRFFWRDPPGRYTHLLGREAGSFDGQGYVSIQLGGVQFKAHHVVWLFEHKRFPASGLVIDHSDGNKTNNQISNLREATRSQNKANIKRPPKSKLGLIGVRRSKKRFASYIKVGQRWQHLGYFVSEVEAAKAYDAAAIAEFGEFAKTNAGFGLI